MSCFFVFKMYYTIVIESEKKRFSVNKIVNIKKGNIYETIYETTA